MKPVTHQHVSFFSIAMLTTLLALFISAHQPRPASAEAEPSHPTTTNLQALQSSLPETSIPSNCRYGVATLWTNETAPWLPYVGAGWYLNFGSSPASVELPNHAEFVYTLRMKDGVFDPPLSSIDAKLASNPGQLWLVGNEIEVQNDSTGDGTYPADYAVAYHTAYDYIKQRDPAAQVGIGGMSMATPARLQYLDLAWAAYQNAYGVDMPVDVWNIHLYILNEWKSSGDNQGDGRIALGTDPAIAKRRPNGAAATECPKEDVYCRAEHDSLVIFDQQLRGMRQWMKDNGQQNKPLIISEFGLLFQPGNADEFGVRFPASRVNTFMTAAFDYLETTKDAAIGYPADENRLVQQWLWFGFVTEPGWSGYSSDLLKQNFRDYELGNLNAFNSVGTQFRSELQSRTVTPNLAAISVPIANGSSGSAQIKIGIRNNGTTAVDQPFSVTFYSDAALTHPIGTTIINSPVNGCHWHNETHSAEITWTNLSQGTHTFWAKVDSGNAIGETTEADNVTSGSIVIEPPLLPTLAIAKLGADLNLTWTDARNATRYHLYRGPSPNFSSATPYRSNLSGLSYRDTNVGNDANSYFYQVTAETPTGESAPSNIVGKFVFPIESDKTPDTPTITVQTSGSNIILNWSPVSGATSYRIYRNVAGSPYFTPTTVYDTDTAPPYTDSGALADDKNYTYLIQATCGTGCESGYSNRVGKFVFIIQN